MAHMDTTRVTQEQVDAAQALVTAAASQGYDAFRAAQAARDALIARRDEESGAASEMVYVVGETFRAKDRLRRMGLRWDAGHHAWVGTRAQVRDGVPTGCRIVDRATAGLASMDHADSAY